MFQGNKAAHAAVSLGVGLLGGVGPDDVAKLAGKTGRVVDAVSSVGSGGPAAARKADYAAGAAGTSAKSAKADAAASKAPAPSDAEASLVYRGGSDTVNSLTPRPGIDSEGLSTWGTPAAAAPGGGKVQVIGTGKLKCTVACPDADPPGHVSIRP
ncbi:MAG: hypothetical protein LBD77_11780, partial [Bifidobacteriaceae bacterium]|nr:hypothetical protein [Bifidobacteriaceae bacterium]